MSNNVYVKVRLHRTSASIGQVFAPYFESNSLDLDFEKILPPPSVRPLGKSLTEWKDDIWGGSWYVIDSYIEDNALHFTSFNEYPECILEELATLTNCILKIEFISFDDEVCAGVLFNPNRMHHRQIYYASLNADDWCGNIPDWVINLAMESGPKEPEPQDEMPSISDHEVPSQ